MTKQNKEKMKHERKILMKVLEGMNLFEDMVKSDCYDNNKKKNFFGSNKVVNYDKLWEIFKEKLQEGIDKLEEKIK